MEDGLALDIKEERDEFRQRLKKGHNRPMLFFPEGRVVQVPKTIMSFQNHLLQGQRVKVVCLESSYTSYFVDHTQAQIPFFREPYASLKQKVLWDSLSESFPFLISLITVFETKVIGTVELTGSETLDEIDVALYSPYFDNDFSLVDVDPALAKKLLNSLYL